jgi:hypothetical protein
VNCSRAVARPDEAPDVPGTPEEPASESGRTSLLQSVAEEDEPAAGTVLVVGRRFFARQLPIDIGQHGKPLRGIFAVFLPVCILLSELPGETVKRRIA